MNSSTSEKIRVLLVMEATIGGTRKHLGQLAEGLDRDRFETTVACSALREPRFRDDLARMRDHGVRVAEIPMRREIAPAADLAATLRLRRWLREHPQDVVHTHSSKAGVVGRTAARLGGVRTIVHTPHSFAFLHDAEFAPRRRAFYLAIERFFGRRTTRLVAVSAAEGRAAVAHGIIDEERLCVIRNGLEEDLAATTRHASCPGIGPDDRVLGCVGLLEPAKGQAFLIDALARLRDEFPALRVVLVGDGGLRERLERRARDAGVGERVIFLGARERAIELMHRFEILVVPSRWEGLPYVLLEGMSLGKAVVASDVGGCGEVVVDGETGRLVPPRDSEALADALRELLRDPERSAAMGAKGRERAASLFSLRGMVAAHEDLYERLAREAR